MVHFLVIFMIKVAMRTGDCDRQQEQTIKISAGNESLAQGPRAQDSFPMLRLGLRYVKNDDLNSLLKAI